MRVPILLIFTVVLLPLLNSCGTGKRYKPVVKYSHPSGKALQTILRGTYGDPYRYAGQGPNRFDCSGLVYYSYGTMNLWLPRTAQDQSRRGRTVPVSDLQYGDLIFFDTRKHFRGKVNHVGIYIGGNRFLHASSSKGRVVSGGLHNTFYRRRIIVCKRLIPQKRDLIIPQKVTTSTERTALVSSSEEGLTTPAATPASFQTGRTTINDNNSTITNESGQNLY